MQNPRPPPPLHQDLSNKGNLVINMNIKNNEVRRSTINDNHNKPPVGTYQDSVCECVMEGYGTLNSTTEITNINGT